MIQARERLFRRLEELSIVAPILPYPAHQRVEEGKALRGQMAGTFTKNLLLKDKKGRFFLVAVEEDRSIDLKTLHKRIGGSGQLSFAAPDQVRAVLGIEPGALSPFALINDADSLVTVVIDADLMEVRQINFHPLVQTESIGVGPCDLLRFMESCGRKPLVIDLGAESLGMM